MAVGDIFRVTIKAKYDGQDCVNVYHIKNVQAGAEEQSTLGIATHYRTEWIDNVIPHLSANYQLYQVDAQRLQPTLSAIASSPVNPVVPGGLIGDSLPGTVATVITLRTDFGGKSRRGRSYICAPPENMTVMGMITEAYRTLLSTGFGTFKDEWVDISGNHFRFGVLSQRSTVTPPGTFTEITDHVVQPVLGNMRSRRIGRGT